MSNELVNFNFKINLFQAITHMESKLKEPGSRVTDDLLRVLIQSPHGISKRQILELIDPKISQRSIQYVESLEATVSKRIQRARAKSKQFGLNVCFDQNIRKWRLQLDYATATMPKFVSVA